MTQYYEHISSADEESAAKAFSGFVRRTDRKGQPRTEAVFTYPPDALSGYTAPYDILRPLFRVTGAVAGGVGHAPDGKWRVTLSSPQSVSERIQEILAQHSQAKQPSSGYQR